MKVLILSCSAGGGHNAAAKAIGEELTRLGIEYKVKNGLDFVPKFKKDFVEIGHTLAYKYIPKIYGILYVGFEKQKDHRSIYLEYSVYANKISRYIKKNGYDTAICVHEFPAFMLTAARRLKKLSIRQYFVSTDYSVAPGMELTDMDAYFVPADFKDAFLEKVPGKAVVETGIPIAPVYYEKRDKAEIRSELGIPQDAKLALVSAGSIGCGPIRLVAEKLLAGGDENRRVAILCGNNHKLYKSLAAKNHGGCLIPLGFTNRVPEWMAAADIMISKAGGLSTTEAASAGIPLVLMDAVQGLEEKNLHYFVDNGLAVTGGNVNGICAVSEELLSSEEKTKALCSRQKEKFQENAVEKLCAHVVKENAKDQP